MALVVDVVVETLAVASVDSETRVFWDESSPAKVERRVGCVVLVVVIDPVLNVAPAPVAPLVVVAVVAVRALLGIVAVNPGRPFVDVVAVDDVRCIGMYVAGDVLDGFKVARRMWCPLRKLFLALVLVETLRVARLK